ncbi:SWIM zinc finger family protein [Streptomyces sp. NBC_01591]|uniref:SWIM zinc finger family protein n=1 Tax=Streptomyces sp. NBC_01591 TaxID=2975888 RepID=UPI002DD8B369|nr:SWIM zinc finger family protein [Streptomyces sp. NBC_01591]WSD69620.1 SWIM zinc finger family protein [Streptomyces sp. NBC_01591]
MSASLPGQRRAPARGKRSFAATWWGQAWVTALEDSTLDAGRLSRGRTYARKGMVGATTVAPGQVKAAVQGSQPRPYRSSVHLPVLTGAQWDTLLDTIAARAGHLAALLDGEMPAELVDDARRAGVPLLPQPTELDPECSCPDWGYPCKHAAALCYAIAATIDADPFVLFALRGRSREEVLAQLRARRTTTQETASPPAPAGIPAAAAYTRWAEHAPQLPERPEPAAHTTALPVPPPPGSGLATTDLERLMTDAAARAARLLAGDTASLHLTQHQDAVRIAAGGTGHEWFHRLIENTGTKPATFARLTRAWRHGGAMGLTVAEQPHTPDPSAMAAARTALTTALTEMTDAHVPLRAWRNRLTLTDHGIQLRLGPDARWYPYLQDDDGEWWPAAPADPDPVAALTAVWQQTRE